VLKYSYKMIHVRSSRFFRAARQRGRVILNFALYFSVQNKRERSADP
jgi:hypothetical protein